jgi:hypothetical protein
MMILSETSPPLCSTSAVFFPNGVPRSSSRRKIAPGEVTGNPELARNHFCLGPFARTGRAEKNKPPFHLSPVEENSDASNYKHGDPHVQPH